MRAKLLGAAIIFECITLQAQNSYITSGKFEFIGAMVIPENFETGPGQLSKDGKYFVEGLAWGNIDDRTDMLSDIYLIPVGKSYLSSADADRRALHLPNAADSISYSQCSTNADNSIIVYTDASWGGWTDNNLAIARFGPNGQCMENRQLDEINDPSESDAYPWLSPDAMDLYFIRDTHLMHASRKSTVDRFSPPEAVQFEGDSDLEILSIWLTPDQKKMYIISDNNILVSSRKSADAAFSKPELYTDEFKDFDFISGLSFSAKEKYMYVYSSDEDQKILVYKRGKK